MILKRWRHGLLVKEVAYEKSDFHAFIERIQDPNQRTLVQ